jgi:hypothetical protein
MNDKVDWQFLFLDTRARVYLVWAFLVTVGFIATHFYQVKQINAFWTFLSIIGMYYMYRTMPLRVNLMRHIFLGWLFTIIVGMVISGAVFIFLNSISGYLITHLGGFWLLLMAQAYAVNGYIDKPAKWYYFAALLNGIFGLLCLTLSAFLPGQYLIAAVVSAWSMLFLWLFRADFS